MRSASRRLVSALAGFVVALPLAAQLPGTMDPTFASAGVLADCLARAGADASRVLDEARTPASKERLREQTELAVSRGIFGAPSFVVDGELFWGNDRLEAALDLAASRPS